jgi:hypothetical protein
MTNFVRTHPSPTLAASLFKISRAYIILSLSSALTSPSTNGRPILFQVNPLLVSANSSLTTFSPSGKLAQIEYALAAVGQGLPSLGIRCSNGVVLASEKPHPSILTDQSSFEKISRITPDAGVVYSGMGPDFRVLVDKARKGAHAVNL